MLIDPHILGENLGIILGLVTLVMVGKAIIVFPIIWQFGYSFKTAIITSLGLNQIGEFSFVLALVGYELDFISQEQYLLLIGATAIALVLTPISMKLSPQIASLLANWSPIAKYLRQRTQNRGVTFPQTICDHVVVAGYGRVGQVIVKIVKNLPVKSDDPSEDQSGHQVLVIENSEAAIRRLRHEQIPYIFGDADVKLVLEKAHLHKAKALAIALPDPASTRLLLQHALELAPDLPIVVRSHSNAEIDWLTNMGAKEVVQPEFEAALEMGGQILTVLGEPSTTVGSVLRTIRRDRYISVRSEATPTETNADS
jgi:CPA2 family monovalent cation:H+ antiporter-2